MKGIILAGGSGTRLHPITLAVSKQLMPVYDKPMIYYPLSTLMYAGIREILIISTPQDAPLFKNLLGDGSALGCTFSYAVQDAPRGLAEAFIIGEDFIGNSPVGLPALLQQSRNPVGGTIFAYQVQDPQRYGVVRFNEQQQAVSIEEKPLHPSSNYAVPGIYFYDHSVVSIAKSISPSARGELEITDVNMAYLNRGQLKVEILDKGTAWLDTGTFESLMAAGQFVEVLEARQGLSIGAIELAAFEMGYIDLAAFKALAAPLLKSGYGKNLLRNIPS